MRVCVCVCIPMPRGCNLARREIVRDITTPGDSILEKMR